MHDARAFAQHSTHTRPRVTAFGRWTAGGFGRGNNGTAAECRRTQRNAIVSVGVCMCVAASKAATHAGHIARGQERRWRLLILFARAAAAGLVDVVDCSVARVE